MANRTHKGLKTAAVSHNPMTRRSALSLAIAATLSGAVGLPSAAYAQEEPAVLEEVVVTGIRASIENSMLLKKESTSLVEAVSAEEIGKLPDVSIAESLARLPGLTAQRLNGRGQVISVRGLSPDFTNTLLNGREQVSTGDNRGVEFDQFPSELLSGVVVYKTPDAALLGQGLAGTVDLRTIRPLEYGKQAVAANLRYESTSLDALNAGSKTDGWRYSLSYVDQFAEDTLGIAIGYAHMSNPSQEERFNAWGYADGPAGNRVIGGAKPFVRSGELTRDGIIGVLEYKPNETFSTSIDVYYSEFTEDQQLRGIEFPLQWGGSSFNSEILCTGQTTGPCAGIPAYQASGGLITSGTYADTMAVVNQHLQKRESDVFSIGWNTKVAMGEAWQGVVDLNHSKVNREDTLLESNSGTGWNFAGERDDVFFTMTDRGAVLTSTVDYTTGLVLTSPRGWGGTPSTGQVGYLNNPTIEDELNQIRLGMNRELDGAISGMDFGINYSDRQKNKTAEEFFLGLAGGATSVPIANPTGITDLSFVGIQGMLSYDPLAVLNSGGYVLLPNVNNDVIGVKPWEVTEKVTVGYAKFDISTDWGAVPVRGNFGLQYVYTDQSSRGAAAGAETVVVEDGDKYGEVLPSLNLQFNVAEDQYVRFALARTLSRPRMDDLRASKQYTFNEELNVEGATPDNGPWGGSSGNPRLQPWIANAADLSYEWYFQERKGYLALALFYKDLDSYIYRDEALVDFSGIPVEGVDPIYITEGFVEAPANADGGSIKGVEFSFSGAGEMLTDALTGFGMIFTFSYTDSSITVPNQPTTSIPGLSEKIANLTLYYENHGWSFRVSDRYRSDFLGEVSGFGAGRDYRLVQEESVVDAQIGYSFTEGPMNGFSIVLQGNNLTDEPFSTFNQGDSRQIIDYQVYGRTYLLGVSYKMP